MTIRCIKRISYLSLFIYFDSRSLGNFKFFTQIAIFTKLSYFKEFYGLGLKDDVYTVKMAGKEIGGK